MMRVLYIADPVEVGGASKSLVDVVTAMTRYGVECVVCTSEHGNIEKELKTVGVQCIADGHMAAMEVPPESKIKRIPVYVLRKLQYQKSLKRAMKIIESQIDMATVDIIHTNSARNDLGCELARKYSIPHIMHIREFGEEDFGCWTYRRNYGKFLNDYTDTFICISNAIKASWMQKGISSEKMSVIYNGVDEARINKIDTVKHYLTKELRMVIVGGVCEAKGQIEAIRAMALLPKNVQANVYLDIIGWGNENYIKQIEREIESLGLRKNINLLGAKDDVGERLCNYQVGLMCSRAEGFGRVTVEYMHAGLGVIASKAGANEEIIENNVTGLLYTKGNAQELANKMREYFENRSILSRCAKKGREHAENNFTKSINAKNIYNIYVGLMAKK